MKTQRNIFRSRSMLTVLLTALVVLLFGCKNFLNKAPQGQQTQATFFKTQQDAIDATNATYNILRDWQVHVFSWIGVTDIVSDDADKGSTPTDAGPGFLGDLDNLTFGPNNLAFHDTWQGYYKGIYRANLAITSIPKINMNSTLQNRLIGENKFLRAYFYFFLVRAYGTAPLITKPLDPNAVKHNSTPDSLYTQIETDLKDAIAVLPTKGQYSSADLGRATKGAAEGLLAKVYLYRKDYQNAKKYAMDVINSGQYSLSPDYAKIFTPSGENGSGTIFSVQATATASNEGGSQYNQVQGVRGVPNLGWGFNDPSKDLQSTYEPGDPRQEATFLYNWEDLPYGPSEAVHDNPQTSNIAYNQKAYVSPDHPGGQGTGPGNVRILRYSDVLLIAAEADYQTGDMAGALKYLNMVRARARDGRTATIGVNVENMAGVIADTLGMPNMAGHPFVRYVWSNSPAGNAGISSFKYSLPTNSNNAQEIRVDTIDVIQSVNGTSVSSMSDYYNAMKNVAPGTPVILQIERITQAFNSGQTGMVTSNQTMTMTLNAIALLPDITATGDQLLHDIWHERRVELAMEQHRWFDLMRQNSVEPGWAASQMKADGKTFAAKDTLYPIPQQEIDLSNGSIRQNVGWQ